MSKLEKLKTVAIAFMLMPTFLFGQGSVNITVKFNQPLQEWDGFGVNYVEPRHTRDFDVFPQDYGGLKGINDEQRAEIIDLIFGENGFKPGIVRVLLDPFHEPVNDNDDPYLINMEAFDHETTNKWLRYFMVEGYKKTKSWGGDLTFLATLYGPPAWTTRQKVMRGRDLDPEMKLEVAEYLVSWAKYLKEQLNLPVKYISPYNEGEAQNRWKGDGGDEVALYSSDYNMWWPHYQIVDFIKYANDVLYANNMLNVKITTGETASWRNFTRIRNWDSVKVNIAHSISIDKDAMQNLGLITSHGFGQDFSSEGIDMLRRKNPDLHAWSTSYSWGAMTLNDVVEHARRLIYETKNNGLIPWATIHNNYESDKLSPPGTVRRSSNANSPIKTNDGQVEVNKAYYLFKQISRAGQPGMRVAAVTSDNPMVNAIAFVNNNTRNRDVFLIVNTDKVDHNVNITVEGSVDSRYAPIITSDVDFSDLNYMTLKVVKSSKGKIVYKAPARSVTTFYKEE
jgi:hypothetical protein